MDRSKRPNYNRPVKSSAKRPLPSEAVRHPTERLATSARRHDVAEAGGCGERAWSASDKAVHEAARVPRMERVRRPGRGNVAPPTREFAITRRMTNRRASSHSRAQPRASVCGTCIIRVVGITCNKTPLLKHQEED